MGNSERYDCEAVVAAWVRLCSGALYREVGISDGSNIRMLSRVGGFRYMACGGECSRKAQHRIVDSELGTYDLFFADKSAPYARASLRMMWVYSIIRAKHSTVPISTEERVVVNETLNIPIIPARFVIPRVSEMYWDTIPTDGVI